MTRSEPSDTGATVQPGQRDAAAGLDGLPQRTLGRYEILRRLAMGGMAELYLARARGLPGVEKIVAIKRILPHLAAQPDFVNMFLDEGRIAVTLSHPNVVQTFDVEVDDGNYFIAMEYLHGEDLRQLVRTLRAQGRRLPLEHAIQLTLCILAALHYAHEKVGLDGRPLAIVHRDVSPQNVIVTYDGAVKLLDFGIAKSSNRASRETRYGTVKGKTGYMSPEQCRGEPLDRRSDLFSVGIVLYELATGRWLYRGPSEFDVFKQIIDGPLPSARVLDPAFPPELDAILARALQKDPERRYQTAREMARDLEAAAHARHLSLSPLALSSFMEDVFGKRIEAWREALRDSERMAERLAALKQAEETGEHGESGEREGDMADVMRRMGGARPTITGTPSGRIRVLAVDAEADGGEGETRVAAIRRTPAAIPALRPPPSPKSGATPSPAVSPARPSGMIPAVPAGPLAATPSSSSTRPSASMPAQPAPVARRLSAGLPTVLVAPTEPAAPPAVAASRPRAMPAHAPASTQIVGTIRARRRPWPALAGVAACALFVALLFAIRGMRSHPAASAPPVALPAPVAEPAPPAHEAAPPAAPAEAAAPAVAKPAAGAIVPSQANAPAAADAPVAAAAPPAPSPTDDAAAEPEAEAAVDDKPAAPAHGPRRPMRRASARPHVAAGPPGHLILDAMPWANVTLDGKPLGPTPINTDVPAGLHKVVLTFTQPAERRALLVNVPHGQTVRKKVTLGNAP